MGAYLDLGNDYGGRVGTEYDPCLERALDRMGQLSAPEGDDAQGPTQDDLSGSRATRSLRGSSANKELRSKHFLLLYLGPVKPRGAKEGRTLTKEDFLPSIQVREMAKVGSTLPKAACLPAANPDTPPTKCHEERSCDSWPGKYQDHAWGSQIPHWLLQVALAGPPPPPFPRGIAHLALSSLVLLPPNHSRQLGGREGRASVGIELEIIPRSG